MPKYYNADEVDAFLEKLEDDYGGTSFIAGIYTAHNCIRKVPTADVAPVVHAYWIPKKEMIRSPEAKNYNCSACGKESFAYPNCPFCRAIMDEEVKDDAEIH